MEKTTVLHLMNGFSNASIGQIVKRLVESLDRQNYQWYIGGLSNLGEMHADYRKLGAVVFDFSSSGAGTGKSIAQLRRFLQLYPVQIIHSHTIRTLLVAWMAMFNLPLAAGRQVTHVTTKHTLTAPRDRQWGAFYSPIDHLALYLPDFLVPVSHLMKTKILAQPWIDPDRVITIPNAIPCDEYFHPEKRQEFRERCKLVPETIVIGFGGRFEPVKRLDLLLKAFADLLPSFPNIRLALAGEGSLRTQLEQQATQLGIATAVTWLGFCQDIPGFLSALDIYVQSSINEGLPLSVLEAMAARKAVIATNVGGTSEVVRDGETGLLIPGGSVEAIASALQRLLIDPSLRENLAVNGQKYVWTYFDLPVMVLSYEQLYRQLCRDAYELRISFIHCATIGPGEFDEKCTKNPDDYPFYSL